MYLLDILLIYTLYETFLSVNDLTTCKPKWPIQKIKWVRVANNGAIKTNQKKTGTKIPETNFCYGHQCFIF